MSNTLIQIWPGSASFFPGDTPFGFYDNDPIFQCDAESVADWCGKRLGYPLSDVELQDKHFFAAFEEAITEYGNQINTYGARDNILNLLGISTGSSVNLSQTYLPSDLRQIFNLSKAYGTEVGAGGNLSYYTGSINLITGRQIYNLVTDSTVEHGDFSTGSFTIRKIFHTAAPAIARYTDPAGLGTQQVLEQFGWDNFSTGNYLLTPLYSDVLRVQAIEFNDQIRKSSYSFQLTGNRLRIFPIPTVNHKLFFNYTIDSEQGSIGSDGSLNSGNVGKISDLSNIPYYNITYRFVNGMGKQWIRKYALAVSKETLGYIRGKYASLPIPDGEVTLNGSDLISAGQSEKEALITELKETLDQMSRQSQLERKNQEATSLNNQLKFVPLKIYIR